MKQNGRSMTNDQLIALGEQLRKAERAGDMGGAYRLLKLGTPDDAALIAVRAGHCIVSTGDRIFWPHLQRQIAQACRHLCDGFELRQIKANPMSVRLNLVLSDELNSQIGSIVEERETTQAEVLRKAVAL